MKFQKIAQAAVDNVRVGNPEPVADTTVVFLNDDGSYSVTDNGEEVDGLTSDQAVDIIVENLEAGSE